MHAPRRASRMRCASKRLRTGPYPALTRRLLPLFFWQSAATRQPMPATRALPPAMAWLRSAGLRPSSSSSPSWPWSTTGEPRPQACLHSNLPAPKPACTLTCLRANLPGRLRQRAHLLCYCAHRRPALRTCRTRNSQRRSAPSRPPTLTCTSMLLPAFPSAASPSAATALSWTAPDPCWTWSSG